uniref:(S)-2-hydroxy-acid oxidase n=1 Tax=Rhipicephalus pulchellus TaxID=72859 RepID=L7M2E3_RHIPC
MLPHTPSRSVIALLVYLSLLQLTFQGVNAMPRQDEQDQTVVTIDDIQRLGEANLDDAPRGYIGGGAGWGLTLMENIAAFRRLHFRPRSLVDVSKIDTTTTVLGRKISFPLGFSPSASHMISHKDGEFGTARAAQDAGTVMIVSAASTATLADIRASAPHCLLWQQIYIFRNRTLTESIIRMAENQGFAAIVVTVDSPVSGQSAFITNRMLNLPEGLRFAVLEASWPGRTFTFDDFTENSRGGLLSSSVTWEDFRWLRSITNLPLVAKGILTAESALEAYKNGASAVIVSNHGGRQLDGDPASIEALPEVVVAVGDRMEVYLDSGVRSGADAVKAVSLGARAVFVGRPVHWGLAYNGKEGVDKVLEIFRSEFNRTIQLLGVPDSKNLCTDFVAREWSYSQPLHRNCAPREPWLDFVKYNIGN